MTYSNFDLIDIAKTYGIDNLNVVMNDELKYYEFKTGYYIINLEDTDDLGSHWVCLIVENGKCIYWDSFGCLPSHDVENWMKQSKYKYMFNNRIVQDLDSVLCGLFALGVIIYVILTPTDLYEAVDNYTDLFSMEPKDNDIIINDLFKTKFKNI